MHLLHLLLFLELILLAVCQFNYFCNEHKVDEEMYLAFSPIFQYLEFG